MQVETLEEADQKIDAMAAEGKLDPAFLLTMAKAYSGVKETDLVQEEARPHRTRPRTADLLVYVWWPRGAPAMLSCASKAQHAVGPLHARASVRWPVVTVDKRIQRQCRVVLNSGFVLLSLANPGCQYRALHALRHGRFELRVLVCTHSYE